MYEQNVIKKEKISVHDISAISKILMTSYFTFPQIFIYILKTKEYKTIRLDLDTFLKKIGEEIGKAFVQEWEHFIDKSLSAFETAE